MRTVVVAVMVLLLAGAGDAFADEPFKASVQVRHRGELDGRILQDDTKPLTFNQLRTRIGLAYTGTEGVSAFIQLQDSRIWGEEFNTLLDGSANSFDLHQGYILVDKFFVDPLRLKLGRMEVNYGSERLIGSVGWHNVGRAFDGVILTVDSDRLVPDFFYFAEVDSVRVGDRGDMAIVGTNMDIITTDKYKTQALLVWQRNVPSDKLSRGTVALYANGNHGSWGHETEAAYQFGNITPRLVYGSAFATDSLEVDIRAWMVTFNLWYQFKEAKARPKLSAGVEALSGTKAGQPEGSQFKTFDTLYATNHKFYGHMDYFLSIPLNTFGGGLIDYHGKLDLAAEKHGGRLAYYYFQSHENVALSTNGTSRNFGQEIDLTYSYRYNNELRFVVGASAFIPGEIFKDKRGENTGLWGYVMTTLAI